VIEELVPDPRGAMRPRDHVEARLRKLLGWCRPYYTREGGGEP
jgi:hypothetical protein